MHSVTSWPTVHRAMAVCWLVVPAGALTTMSGAMVTTVQSTGCFNRYCELRSSPCEEWPLGQQLQLALSAGRWILRP
jgi:hypothetical protein